MIYRISFKNAPGKFALLDKAGYDAVKDDPYLAWLKFMENLVFFKDGYAKYQQNTPAKGKKAFQTVYLHRWLAEKFIKKPESTHKLYFHFKRYQTS